MKVFALCLLVACAAASSSKHPCDEKECKVGRECVLVDGVPQCLCQVACPERLKPVCGSDGVTYDNHCRLHQKACITGDHISVSHKGYCKKSFDKNWKSDARKSLLGKDDLQRELENDLIDHLKKEADSVSYQAPIACFAPQREALRFLLVKYWEDNQKSQSWFSKNMDSREALWGWFLSCNSDKDNRLTPDELLLCSKNVSFFERPGQDRKITKALCVDALVSDGDKNDDLGLNFQEFSRIFDPKYRPVEKKCSLNNKNYLDGEDVRVNCDHCVCAVGQWVCSSAGDCKDGKTKKSSSKSKDSGKDDGDFDNFIDESDIPEASAVIDEWLEEAKKEKSRAKAHKKQSVSQVDEKKHLDLEEDLSNSNLKEESELLNSKNSDDFIYERTKSKQGKKKLFKLEKALKKLNALTKETEELKAILGLSKPKLRKFIHEDKKSSVKKGFKDRWVSQGNLDQEANFKKPQHTKKSKEYYDKVFKNTHWNDLIDWGEFGEKPYKGDGKSSYPVHQVL